MGPGTLLPILRLWLLSACGVCRGPERSLGSPGPTRSILIASPLRGLLGALGSSHPGTQLRAMPEVRVPGVPCAGPGFTPKHPRLSSQSAAGPSLYVSGTGTPWFRLESCVPKPPPQDAVARPPVLSPGTTLRGSEEWDHGSSHPRALGTVCTSPALPGGPARGHALGGGVPSFMFAWTGSGQQW